MVAVIAKVALVALILLVGTITKLPAGWEVLGMVLSLFSPILLKKVPANIKGKPMVIIAVALAFVLGGLAMLFQGDLNNFNPANAAQYVLELVGLQQLFFALFKDNWNLATP